MQLGEYMARSERERKRKRGKRKYGQAKLKHSKRGVWSCALSGGVLLFLVLLLAIAYTSRGTAAPIIGAVGLMTMGLAVGALCLGVKGFREREKDYITCYFGTISSGVFIFGFIIIFCRGLF